MFYTAKMLIRQIRLILFLALALLQCVAPLIHGHISGPDADGVHLHVGTAHHLDAHHAGTEIQAADDHGAAIGVAATYKRDFVLLPGLAALGLLLILLTALLTACRNPLVRWRSPAPAPHSRPYANAPPVPAA